ncbi:MAG: ABC transporter ATP-binding protein [Christensenellaceae bacterium]|jgi:spermidine/putrescine transport system ATP-binding protein|nr:ABC transporter ATP-binding protein [Christensenellaceae bacterium]
MSEPLLSSSLEVKSVSKPSNSNIIELKGVSKSFDGKPVVKDLTLSIKKGEFVTLLGPSGCGKTTTLRMIAGFEKPSNGTIYIGGQDVTALQPNKRPVNTVFQQYALFPHLNVAKNIAYGISLKKIPTGETVKDKKTGEEYPKTRKYTIQEVSDKVQAVLEMVDLEGYEKRSVNTLSGGQKQRVAIARALVNEPKVLLLDEPLGALDLKMRKDMQIELMDMHKKLGITFVYVTHDQEEALTMSDTIVVMRDGEVQQIGTPQKIYDEPANAFVADFIGESNIFVGVMRADYKCEVCDAVITCVDSGFKKDESVDVIIRPEDVQIVPPEKAVFTATVKACVFKGDHFQTIAEIDNEDKDEILSHDNTECKVGEKIGLYVKPFDIHIMHRGRIINELITTMEDENLVNICGGKFECNAPFPYGTKVKVTIDFDDIDLTDDENDGTISATIQNTIYLGSYWRCVARTDDFVDFFSDTEYDWLKGDRVGINIPKDKILVEKIDETADETLLDLE